MGTAAQLRLLWRSFSGEDGGVTLSVYQSVFQQKKFGQALGNSFLIAGLAAGLATIVAFILAYTCYYTNLPKRFKNIIRLAAMLPMFLSNDHIWFRNYLLVWSQD